MSKYGKGVHSEAASDRQKQPVADSSQSGNVAFGQRIMVGNVTWLASHALALVGFVNGLGVFQSRKVVKIGFAVLKPRDPCFR